MLRVRPQSAKVAGLVSRLLSVLLCSSFLAFSIHGLDTSQQSQPALFLSWLVWSFSCPPCTKLTGRAWIMRFLPIWPCLWVIMRIESWYCFSCFIAGSVLIGGRKGLFSNSSFSIYFLLFRPCLSPTTLPTVSSPVRIEIPPPHAIKDLSAALSDVVHLIIFIIFIN